MVLSSALGFSPRPPVSVCGTDGPCIGRGDFLGSMASTASARNRPRRRFSGMWVADLPTTRPTGLNRDCWSPDCLAFSTPPRHRTRTDRYGNVDPSSIGYAFRPRLRIRLTLGGLTLPRKPRAFGDADSHCVSRYSCPHTHSDIVQESSPSPFVLSSDAPLPNRRRSRRRMSWLRYHA
jgi:hypothetical protein